MRKLVEYFLKGLLIVLPGGLTVYIIYRIVHWLNSIFAIGNLKVPGLGILLALVTVTLIGVLFSGIIGTAFFKIFDKFVSKTPFVNLIYSSIKDLMEAFVGEKKKFTEPVLVELYPGGVQGLGFITRKDLTHIKEAEKVAVYFPYSYSVAGQLLIVPKDKITHVDANSTEVMRFLISAGITGL